MAGLENTLSAFGEEMKKEFQEIKAQLDRVHRDLTERLGRVERDQTERLERLERRWDEHLERTQRGWNERFEGAERGLDRRFKTASRQVARRFKSIDKDVLRSARAGYARTLNSSARTFNQPLYPIPFPDGRLPGSLFPDTFGDLVGISEDTLVDLLLIYELADEDSLPESVQGKRELFAEHCGIRLLY